MKLTYVTPRIKACKISYPENSLLSSSEISSGLKGNLFSNDCYDSNIQLSKQRTSIWDDGEDKQ